MPKMKTKRGAAKRFKANAGGKFSKGTSYKRHNTGKKSNKWGRVQRGSVQAKPSEAKRLKVLMPYV